MMPKISRYAIILLLIISQAILLPNLYWMVFDKPATSPQVQYSPIIKDFVFAEKSGNDTRYHDAKGNTYDRKSFETLLPFSYYYDLDKWGILPDTIAGIPISISFIRRNTQFVRVRPVDLNTPLINLNPLFESQSDYTRLEMPDYLFRIDKKFEFLDSRSNTVNDSLSRIFHEALMEQGFRFPARIIAGNPTTRKSFDEGYFIIDAQNRVFHLKQIKGQPICSNTGIPTDLNIRYISIREHARREFYGLLVTTANEVYLIGYDNYQLIKLPTRGYNADNMSLMLQIDPIYKTVRIFNKQELYCTVMDQNYNIVDTFQIAMSPKSERFCSKVAALLFPLSVERTNANTDYVLFNIQFAGWLAFIGIAVALLIAVFIKKRVYQENLRENWIDFLIVAISGLFGTLAVLLIRPEPWD
ncbi:MAG TPA: hypothetical protein DHW42_05970 [Candidatus Marinimicrobia bacterium]|nr:hypothetical protein [Candidatus Neomarinimicrobiota bacterium]